MLEYSSLHFVENCRKRLMRGKSSKKVVSRVWKRVEKNIYSSDPYTFQVRITRAGHSISKVFDSLDEALIYRDMRLSESALDTDEARIFAARAAKRDAKGFTVDKALLKYSNEITPAKKGAAVELTRIGKARRTDFARISMYMVKSHNVEQFLDEIGGSENNKRKYVSLISHLFKIAQRVWKKDVTNPVTDQIVLPSNGRPRKRRLQSGEFEKLLKYLSGEPAVLFSLAVETGMRRSELLNLQWRNVNLKKRAVHLVDTKNGEDRYVALSHAAVTNLQSLHRGVGNAKVFKLTSYELRSAWEQARVAAGIPDLRWHDLRHEGTSRLFERGLNVIEVSSMTGHKTLSMLNTYTHLSPSSIISKLDSTEKE